MLYQKVRNFWQNQFSKKELSDQIQQNIIKIIKIPYNTLLIHKKYLKTSFALHFQEMLTKKNTKFGQLNLIYKKHTVCPIKNFTQALKVLNKLGLCGLQVFKCLIYIDVREGFN